MPTGRSEDVLSNPEFIARLCHEVRSPLAGMVGFAGELEERAEGANRELAGRLARNGRHVIETLEAVMELARAEAVPDAASIDVADVVALVRERVASLRARADAAGLPLHFVAEEEAAYARVHPVYVGRIVHHLVDNALRYTDAGRVEVSVEAREGYVWIYIADTGRGMGPALRARAFAPFERGADVEAGPAGSVGLGLTITRRLVELMEGQIFLCSTEGSGSTFTVRFPEADGGAGSARADAGAPQT